MSDDYYDVILLAELIGSGRLALLSEAARREITERVLADEHKTRAADLGDGPGHRPRRTPGETS